MLSLMNNLLVQNVLFDNNMSIGQTWDKQEGHKGLVQLTWAVLRQKCNVSKVEQTRRLLRVFKIFIFFAFKLS